MKLCLVGYVDLGLSFGIDDHAFTDERVERASRALGLPIERGPDPPDGLALALGNGLTIDLTRSKTAAFWKRKAEERASAELQPLVANLRVERCALTVYALGVSVLHLDLDGFPGDRGKAVVDVFEYFEYAAYEQASKRFKAIFGKFQSCFLVAPSFEFISRRRRLEQTDDFDIFPGFLCLAVCEQGDDLPTIVSTLQVYERQYSFQRLDLDDGIVHLGWASCAIEPPRRNADRIIYLLHVTQLFYGICQAFEQLFVRKMAEAVRSHLGDTSISLDAKQLNELRSLAATVVQFTTLPSTSDNISDLYLFDAFERLAKIGAKQDRIRAAASVFVTVQTELARMKEAARERRLGRALFFLTSLTCISVLADIINTVDYVHDLVPRPLVRFALLLILPIVVLLVLWRMVTGRRRGQIENGDTLRAMPPKSVGATTKHPSQPAPP